MTTGVHGALISVSSFLRSGYAPGYLWKAGIATYPARFLLQRPCPASGNEEGSFRLPSGVKACAAHLQVQQSGAVGAVRLTRVILCEPGGTPVYENRGDLEARLQKNGSVRFRDRRTDQFVCTDYGDRVVFHNHHDRNELADKLDLIAPVLFERDPRMGFEPEGNDRQFNQVFAEMVAWHNVTERTGHGDYTISQPDVDHHREGSERYYRGYINAHAGCDRAPLFQEDEKGGSPRHLYRW